MEDRKRVNKLNELGFDVDELEMKTAEDGKRVLVRPRVVDAATPTASCCD